MGDKKQNTTRTLDGVAFKKATKLASDRSGTSRQRYDDVWDGYEAGWFDSKDHHVGLDNVSHNMLVPEDDPLAKMDGKVITVLVQSNRHSDQRYLMDVKLFREISMPPVLPVSVGFDVREKSDV